MKKAFIVLGTLATPFMASAQVTQNTTGDIGGLVILAGSIIGMLVPIVSTLVIVFFFWGLAQYVLAAGDEKKAKEGKSIMIWGAVALFVMVSIWGIIGFLQKSLGTDIQSTQSQTIQLPNITPSSTEGGYDSGYDSGYGGGV